MPSKRNQLHFRGPYYGKWLVIPRDIHFNNINYEVLVDGVLVGWYQPDGHFQDLARAGWALTVDHASNSYLLPMREEWYPKAKWEVEEEPLWDSPLT